ncbi:hypothetical protein ACLMAJ_31930 [Nocardia sp. KC 131]|uniref:hypothetical protein n=1 Tax=Nocardia arseniciresistens TaxID=3392119 RepID=UPI00398ED2EE
MRPTDRDDAEVSTVLGFVSWLRNGRTVEHNLVTADTEPSPHTLEARLAALISFCRWQEPSPRCRWPVGCRVAHHGASPRGDCWRTCRRGWLRNPHRWCGDPVTFQSVQREARVSHAFLYNHPELRTRIEHLRTQSQPTRHTPALPPDSESSLVLALTSQITQLKKLHRQQVDELRDALTEAHGENLDLRRELTRRGGTWPSHSYPAPSTQ